MSLNRITQKFFQNKYVVFGILICIGVFYFYNRLWPIGVLFFYLSIPCLFFNTAAYDKVVNIYLRPFWGILSIMEYKNVKVIFTVIAYLTYSFVAVFFICSLIYWVMSKCSLDSPPIVCFIVYIAIVAFLTLSTSSKFVDIMNKHTVEPMCKCSIKNMKHATALINLVLLIIFTYYYCFDYGNEVIRFLGSNIFIGAFATYLAIERIRS